MSTIKINAIVPLLQVFDMPCSLSFYRDKLGFTVMQQSPGGDNCDWVLLGLNQTELMLNTAYEKEQRPMTADIAKTIHHADTCLYFSCPDVEGAYKALLNLELKPSKPITTKYNFTAFELTDPDGYILCFHWQNN